MLPGQTVGVRPLIVSLLREERQASDQTARLRIKVAQWAVKSATAEVLGERL